MYAKIRYPIIYFFAGLVLVLPLTLRAAVLFVSPASGTYAAGAKFTASFRVDSEGVSLNAAEAALSFESEKLEVVSVSKSGSMFSLWTQEPTFSNSSGSISFGGGIPSPGYNGSSGLLFSATLRMKAQGNAVLQYVSGLVLANDGSGTNILRTSRSASYSTPAPKPATLPTPTPIALPNPPSIPTISSPTHPINFLEKPDASSWSNNNNPEFNWKSDLDATSFSYTFDQNPSTIPDTVSEGSMVVKTYTDVEGGLWFFHARAQNAGGWSQVSHYEIHVDATPPEPFTVEIVEGRDVTTPAPHARFVTKDLMSGIAQYEVQLGKDSGRRISPEETSPSVALGPFSPGTYAVRVTAYDRAGNHQEAFAEFTVRELESPVITAYTKTLGSDEVIFLEGKAPPGGFVLVAIERPDGRESVSREIAVNGDWLFLGKQYRAPGKWRITVQSKSKDGALSDAKAEVAIEVIATAVRIGKYAITYVVAYSYGGIALAAIVAILLGVVFMHRKKLRRMHTRLLKEITEAERAVRTGFRMLREDIIEELHTIDALQVLRPLTPVEEGRREKLLKDLAFIEFHINKEVQDIEQVLEGRGIAEEEVPAPPAPYA